MVLASKHCDLSGLRWNAGSESLSELPSINVVPAVINSCAIRCGKENKSEKFRKADWDWRL
jgi:hypothetical protein